MIRAIFFPGSLDVILSTMKKFELSVDHRTLLWPPCSSLMTKQLEFSATMSENSLRLALLKVSAEVASIKNSFSFIIWEIELQPKTVAEWMVVSNKYRPTFEGSSSYARLQSKLLPIKNMLYFSKWEPSLCKAFYQEKYYIYVQFYCPSKYFHWGAFHVHQAVASLKIATISAL